MAEWVERALAANLDVQLARQRAGEARALLRAAMAARAPRFGAAARIDAGSRAGSNGRRIEPSLSLTFDWDADPWGALHWTEVSAAAGALRSEHLLQAARLSTAALTARAYLAWREAGQAEAELAAAIALQREIARLVQVRVDAGLSAQLDALRAQGELAAAEAGALAAAEATRAAARALQLLAGDRHGPPLSSPIAQPSQAPLPQLQGALPVALPADLLRLRPDLRAAEQALRGAEAQLNAADAARLPTLTLPGLLTLGTGGGGALLAQLSAQVAVALATPLFDGGRRDAGRDAARSRVMQALLAYRQTLQQALAEVEAALDATAVSRQRIVVQQRALQQADDAVTQSRALYTAGLAGFGDVLDAQRSALERRQALLRMKGNAARATVAAFEALGLIDEPAGPSPQR
jgi:multidrug efflux system outer membrane protein